MRRAWAVVGVAGAVFAVLGQLDLGAPRVASAVTASACIAFGLFAHGGTALASDAASLGAGGALAYEAARSYLPLIGSGLLLTFVFGARAMRAKSWRELAFHLALAFGAGLASSWVAQARAATEVTLWLLAIGVAALLASVPWLLPDDGPRSFTLRRLAHRAHGPLRTRLMRAAIAARRLGDLPQPLPRRVHRRIARAFDDVIALAERRLEGRGGAAMEQDLARTVGRLSRIARAARRRGALLEAPETDAGAVRMEQERLDAAVSAL